MKYVGDKPVDEVVHARPALSKVEPERRPKDLLRRTTPTPYTAFLPVMGRIVRLETNSPRILGHLSELFARYSASGNCEETFVWRIVSQCDFQGGPPWPKRSVFSDHGLRFAEFGQRNFLAVDIEAREAVAFISQELVEDLPGFTSPFIDTLFYMTAGSLGLVPFAAACVASGTKGLLILGRPNQGKTTASYLAGKQGLSFHADQSVFLEIGSSGLHAWGDFVPVAFRPETLHHLPELRPITRRFSYCDFNFYYLDNGRSNSERANAVTPVCSVVLDRGSASEPSLVPLREADLSTWSSMSLAFKDDDRFKGQQKKVLDALAALRAYRLAYGNDPATVVPFFRRLLATHDVPSADRPLGG